MAGPSHRHKHSEWRLPPLRTASMPTKAETLTRTKQVETIQYIHIKLTSRKR